MSKSTWAVLLCKFNDNDVEPFPRNYYDDLFTSSGAGTQNMVDFFRDMSHQKLDLGDSQIFGWFTLNMKRTDYLKDLGVMGLTEAARAAIINRDRAALLDLVKKTALAAGVNLSLYINVVMCFNVPTDLFGGSNGVVCGSDGTIPRDLAQEMGHGYWLNHSRAEGSLADYNDYWDAMSSAATASAPHPRYQLIGPGLNAANMDYVGWLNSSRVWEVSSGNINTVVELRSLHRFDLPGFLAIKIGGYYIEFRNKEGWDIAMAQPAVLVHQLVDGHSYLISDTNGQQLFTVGSVMERANTSPRYVSSRLLIEVIEIDAVRNLARVRISLRADRFNYIDPEAPLFRNPMVQWGIISEGDVLPISPTSPLFANIEQVALYQSANKIKSIALQNAVKQEALLAIIAIAQAEMDHLSTPQAPLRLQ